jgi:hypothetical protein
MGKKRLSIPIARFEPARALANDVFLHLVLNKRSVRIGEANGEIPPELLERIKEKGYSHLEVSCEDENSDPATYPLYLVSSAAEKELAEKLSRERPSSAEETRLGADGSEEAETRRVKSEADLPEASTRLAGTESEDNPDQVVKGGPNDLDEGNILVKGAAAEEGSILPGAAESDAAKPDATSEQNLAQEGSLLPFPSKQDDLDSDGLTASGAGEEGDAGADVENEASVISPDNSDEEEQLVTGDPSEKPVLFKVNSEEEEVPDSAIFRLEQKLEAAKETLLRGGKFDLVQEKVEILKGAKSTILAAKISDRIIELKKLPGNKGDHQEISELTLSLHKAEAGDDLSQETLGKFSVTKEMKEVETIISADRPQADRVVDLSEHLATYAKSREEAKTLLEKDEEASDAFGPLKKSSAHRDLPNTASRLAAYLGYSLGYTNGTYLSDLAISSIYHFGLKTGREIEDGSLPTLAKLLLQKEENEASVVSDAREILAFLDLYLEDPECDRAEKEFVQKIFLRTADTARREEKINPWNLKCWTSYMDRGSPTLEGHSLCNRAAASAIKFLRTNAKE